jgi:hypothetical protein
MSNELTYEIDPGETVTHFYTPDHKLLCLDLRCATKGMTAASGDASGYDDEGCVGATLECDSCGEYVFPADAAEYDREWEAIRADALREYRLTPRVTRDDLEAYEPGDPKRVMLERYL